MRSELRRGRLAGLVLAAVVVLAPTAGVLAQPKSSFADVQRILDRGTLVAAIIDHDVPPVIGTGEDESPTGFDADLAREIADALDVDIEFERNAATFDEVVEQVADGRADIAVSFLSRTARRSRFVLLSRPYLAQDVTVLINRLKAVRYRNHCPSRDAFIELANRSGAVGVVGGSAYEAALDKRAPGGRHKRFADGAEMWRAVYNGDVELSLQGEMSIKAFLKDNPGYRVRVKLCPFYDTPSDKIAVAVRPDSPNLLRIVDGLLENREISYSVDDILDHEGVWPWQAETR